MIKQRLLGRTGLKISELCLGTLNFGWKTDDRIAFAILDAYYAAGGNFIQATHQSPEQFLPSATVAASEEIVGRWWTSRKLRRQDLFLATRVYLRAPADAADGTLTKLASDACREALRRMQTNYLDLVIFEWSEGFASTPKSWTRRSN
ncbi:MAG TPA: aldo/keto reductase [Acidobacteriota bacterium]|nr:aldo/keto reductase [Acidobacteriota bacterium]